MPFEIYMHVFHLLQCTTFKRRKKNNKKKESYQNKKVDLEKQKCEGNKVNNSHAMDQSPNCRMWSNQDPECQKQNIINVRQG